MRLFRGRNAQLFFVGELFQFTDVPLTSGDGWTWTAPDWIRYWQEETLTFVVDGENVIPSQVWPRSGSALFSKNHGNRDVTVSGAGYPMSLAVTGGRWELNVNVAVHQHAVIGSENLTSVARQTGCFAMLRDVEGSADGQVLALLPSHSSGVFVGLGAAATSPSGVNVDFGPEGVTYDPC